MPVIQVPVVVGEGSAKILLVSKIPFFPSAFAIQDIEKQVIIEDSMIISQQAVISGLVQKSITFKTLDKTRSFGRAHCVYGRLRHCTVEIPFHLVVAVSRALPGDTCHIDKTFIEGTQDDLLDPQNDGTFTTLLEKAIIRLDISLTRTKNLFVNTRPQYSVRDILQKLIKETNRDDHAKSKRCEPIKPVVID